MTYVTSFDNTNILRESTFKLREFNKNMCASDALVI